MPRDLKVFVLEDAGTPALSIMVKHSKPKTRRKLLRNC